MAHHIRILSQEDVRKALSMFESIDVMSDAFSQLSAICAVRNIQKAYIFDPNKEAADAFIDEMQPQCGAKLVLGSSNQALQEVDVICTATDSAKPLFELTDLKQGVHINAIGSFKPTI